MFAKVALFSFANAASASLAEDVDSSNTPTASLGSIPETAQYSIASFLTPGEMFSTNMVFLPQTMIVKNPSYRFHSKTRLEFARCIKAIKNLKNFRTIDETMKFIWSNKDILRSISTKSLYNKPGSSLAELPLQTIQLGQISYNQALNLTDILNDHVSYLRLRRLDLSERRRSEASDPLFRLTGSTGRW